ncbi:bifunctional enoyl-CoA hydratase/phosphate acetyltransferase [Alteribacter populi]|uniref:bifunctional enoyl-CoA hydratase/phosphate acetyltransferase n=1 Tax=Alteribacter populi TaxID=2011011 RepID=UPI000BBAA3B2|nr:bifunctional enoyl-CoA hydratase/phosphate acetyltransferase [Alteribacter populi]
MTFEDLLQRIKANNSNKKKIAIAHAIDESLFLAAKRALEAEVASFVFVGPKETMVKLAEAANIANNDGVTFVDSSNEKESASSATSLVNNGEADVLMKGMVGTSTLLKAVLNKENGLRSGKVLSHVAAFDLPERDSLLLLTDAAMNIAPDLKEKLDIASNAVDVAHRIGMEQPKVAALAAVETVNPAMQATLDAAALTQMNQRGQLKGCIMDGPLAFDISVSPEAAAQKKINSEVAGQADLLLVPSIETGNAIYKSLTIFGKANVGGIIAGAKAPIVLTSRADSIESKLFSMTLAVGAAL